MLFLWYPKCSTCQRAQRWLLERGVAFESRDIREQNPGEEELRAWQALSGLPLRRFFNTSGLHYRELGLKDKLPGMGAGEMLRLLASDGMLVRRPILVGEGLVLVGFRPEAWGKALQ